MLAVSDTALAAFFTASAAMGVAGIGFFSSRSSMKNLTSDVNEQLDTGKEHTAGQSLRRIEEMLWRLEDRVDRLDAKSDELRQFTHEDRTHIRDVAANLAELGAKFDELSTSVLEHHTQSAPLIAQFVEEHRPKGEG